jgi:Flp pilus assembly protein TadD/uncharacterized surface protein with fasciclin (FAS1) repeats
LRWADLFSRGNVAIFGSGVQVVAETLEEEIGRTFPEPRPIDLTIEALHDLLFRHLHPVKISMLRGSPRWMSHPEEHLRALGGQGISQNVLTSHAVAFRPRAVRMSDSFCPLQKLDRVAFEPCRYLSLEPALKHLSLYLHPWQMDDCMLSRFGGWGDHFFSPVNMLESCRTHVYSIGGGVIGAESRAAEISAAKFVAQMQASRTIFRLWRCLHEQGQYSAALWLAAAHLHARLRRRVCVRTPATVFVPCDRALARLAANGRADLLALGGRRLIDTARAHIAEGQYRLGRNDWLSPSDSGLIGTVDGSRYAVATAGVAQIVAGPFQVDDLDVYFIDRPLTQLDVRPTTSVDALRDFVRRVDLCGRRMAARVMGALRHLLERDHRLHQRAIALRIGLRRMLRKSGSLPDAAATRVTEPAMRAYRLGVACRALDAMRELYDHYRTGALAGTAVVVAPAARLDRAALSRTSACAALEDTVRHSPHFAEAWLELGFARLAAGENVLASMAFAQASSLAPTLEQTYSDPDPRTLAATEHARLLTDAGDVAAALAVLEAAPLRPPYPWAFHHLRAQLLLKHGRVDEALECFDRCMTRDHVLPSYAGLLPRNFIALEEAMESARSFAGAMSPPGSRDLVSTAQQDREGA